ncbi:MAG: EamA family transporter RarD [Geobacteraceae bacterium]|nr:EamA family transporter RarD [Geobacteraceae bacterium]
MRDEQARTGFIYGLAAYFIWGFFPVFFKQLKHLNPLEVVSHRIFWSMIFLTILIVANGQITVIRRVLADRRALWYLFVTSLLISTNWLVFIYAVGKGEVLQSSLGYFMTPLINVLLGVIILRERLRPWQIASIVLAMGGVAVQLIMVGKLPLIALVLAATFGLYGLLRKIAPVEALSGLAVETAMLAVPAMGFLFYTGFSNGGHFVGRLPSDTFFLPMAGVLTAVPLILFAAAARRLRLTTIGFLQYITPSLHFFQAVFLYHETFDTAHLISFCCIWTGLLIYTIDSRFNS